MEEPVTTKQACPTCGHMRETFTSNEGSCGFVPPVTDKAQGKEFARVECSEGMTSRGFSKITAILVINGEQMPESLAETAEQINAAVTALLREKEERIKELERALKLLVDDVQPYEPWQRPCHALIVAKDAIKGGPNRCRTAEANEKSLVRIIDEWLHTPTLLLRAGEMTAQEIRTVKAVLEAVKRGVENGR